MNLEIELLKLLPRLFNALDALIENYGVYLYLVLVWLAVAVIAWIISSGLRRRTKGNAAVVISCIIVMTPPPRQPTPPTVDIEVEQMRIRRNISRMSAQWQQQRRQATAKTTRKTACHVPDANAQ